MKSAAMAVRCRRLAGRGVLVSTLAVALSMLAHPVAASVFNDSIVDAQTIAVGSTDTVDMAHATAAEPIDVWASDACGNDEFGWVSTVWYAFTPKRPGIYHIDATRTQSQSLSVIVVTDPEGESPTLKECGLRKTSFSASGRQTYFIGFATEEADLQVGFTLGQGSIQPVADVRYLKRASVNADGTVIVRGLYRCRRATSVGVHIQIGQDPVPTEDEWIEYKIWAEGSTTIAQPRCDYQWHRWTIHHPMFDEGPGYHSGRAAVTALWASVAWCDEIGCVVSDSPNFRGGPIFLRARHS